MLDIQGGFISCDCLLLGDYRAWHHRVVEARLDAMLELRWRLWLPLARLVVVSVAAGNIKDKLAAEGIG